MVLPAGPRTGEGAKFAYLEGKGGLCALPRIDPLPRFRTGQRGAVRRVGRAFGGRPRAGHSPHFGNWLAPRRGRWTRRGCDLTRGDRQPLRFSGTAGLPRPTPGITQLSST